ncbi:inactive dipeptidyl peptidase 10 isoform X3 [Prionailurus iriomotensis]
MQQQQQQPLLKSSRGDLITNSSWKSTWNRALSRVLKNEPNGQRVPSHQVSTLEN